MSTKYIFVTGGVVSGLGKGITAASIGRLLIARGLRVNIQKIDPYLNVDPGTMNPLRHGEVFVTDDGTETDLDLGHYERFLGQHLTRESSYTMGKIYQAIITRERKGDYLGKDVQVVPHVTDELKSVFRAVAKDADVVIIEIGGTAGEIESMTPLEAVRQFRKELGPQGSIGVHVTLVPQLSTSGEVKTKPTQMSVRELNHLGIYPDLIVCRTAPEVQLDDEVREKIAMFCNLDSTREVIHTPDCDTIYQVPLVLKEQGVDDLVLNKLGLKGKPGDLSDWKKLVDKMLYKNGRAPKVVGIVGKYATAPDAYISVIEAVKAAAHAVDTRVEIRLVDSEALETGDNMSPLRELDAILVPGGFGDRGVEGKIETIKLARENNIPFLGICLGMQMAAVEFARNVAGLKDAHTVEINPKTPYPLIDIMPDQKGVEMGGTMRLGLYKCNLKKGSFAHKLYGKTQIAERHRHRYEFNDEFKSQLEDKGLVFSGINPETNLVEIIEIPTHKYFIAAQFHPEFLSKPYDAHPLFVGLVKAMS